MTHDPFGRPSALSLIVAAFTDLADLIRKEARLISAEMSQRMAATVSSLVWLAIAGAIGFVALLALVEGVILIIASSGMPLRWSCLIVAGGLAVIAVVIAAVARARSGLKPTRALRQFRKDVQTAKDQAR